MTQQEAIEYVHINLRGKLERWILSFVKDNGVAELILSDVYIRILTKYNNEVKDIEDWSFIVAKNIALTYLRDNKNKISNVDESHVQVTTTTPETIYLKKDLINRVMRAVEKQPPIRKQIILTSIKDPSIGYQLSENCFPGGMMILEMVDILGMNINTIKSHRLIALKQLRHEFRNDNYISNDDVVTMKDWDYGGEDAVHV